MKPDGKSTQVALIARKALLFCGILAPLIYVGTDLLAASLYEGYSYTDQAISELSAIGAPTSWLWQIMAFIFNPLIIAFGLGVWYVAHHRKSLRIAGTLIMLWGITGFIWLLFPMNMRGSIGSASDTGHLILSGFTVILITVFIAFASGAYGKGFRLYSIHTILVMLIFGAYVGMQSPRVASQQPTPWMGIMERISLFSVLLWMMVLAFLLILKEKKQDLLHSQALKKK
jgi:hypothetical membrane protein